MILMNFRLEVGGDLVEEALEHVGPEKTLSVWHWYSKSKPGSALVVQEVQQLGQLKIAT